MTHCVARGIYPHGRALEASGYLIQQGQIIFGQPTFGRGTGNPLQKPS
ncbi:hypothetical protein ACFSHR_18030 [Azotobacter chroococcum]